VVGSVGRDEQVKECPVLSVRPVREEQCYRPADSFVDPVSEELGGAEVPVSDKTVFVGTDDRAGRGVYKCVEYAFVPGRDRDLRFAFCRSSAMRRLRTQ